MTKRTIRKFGFSIKKEGEYYCLRDHKKKIDVLFGENPGIGDIYALVGYQQGYKLKKGDVVIDGGGLHGLAGLYFSKLVGDEGKIFIFEPDPVNFLELQRNIKVNGNKNVYAINKGLRSKKSSMELVIQGSGSSVFFEKNDHQKTCTVDLIDPISELASHGVHKIDFFKMDIEGAEIAVIEGMKEYLKKHNIHFAIAAYHILPGELDQTYKRLEELFKEIGYKYRTGFYGHLTTYASK